MSWKPSRVEPRETALVPTSDQSDVGAVGFFICFSAAYEQKERQCNEFSKHDFDVAAVLGGAKLYSRYIRMIRRKVQAR